MRNLQADTPAKQPQDLHALYAKQVQHHLAPCSLATGHSFLAACSTRSEARKGGKGCAMRIAGGRPAC